MKLYDCAVAPNPRRARMFIAEKGLDIPKVEIDILGGENLKDSFLAVNPRGLLPVLELDDGTRFDEAMAICRYLEELHPDPPLLGTTPVERAQIECMQRKMEFEGMIATSEVFRNKLENDSFAYRSLPGVASPAIPGLVERGTQTLERFFHWLEKYLEGGNKFIMGDRFTMVDITAVCAVDFAKWVDITIPGANRNSLRWYDEVSARPSASA
ncbi:glutathione S-transferase family protein [Porticoccus sp.]|uniref:glutathione S-transferase family protein n=1 Tax=Porticoccus sp. TaxID=2024853 RepID=UPI003F69C536